MRIILASASPRRQKMLNRIMKDFEIVVTDIDEAFVCDTPEENVMTVARDKVMNVQCDSSDIVIGCDTTVFMNGSYYNKPINAYAARLMLEELAGRVHQVYTGVCIRYNDMVQCFYDKADVEMNQLTSSFIKDYIASGSPLDKAGSYGIQDEGIVKSYNGDYDTIMGLPVVMLKDKLREII